MSDERILEIIENQDKYYVLGFIKGIKANINILMQENVELKKQLNELQETQIFIDTQDIEERYGEGLYQEYLEKENKELKKQLEDMTDCRNIASGHRKEVQDRETILLKQQQEFITYLKDKIKLYDEEYDNLEYVEIYEVILQDYLEIIGVSDDKTN